MKIMIEKDRKSENKFFLDGEKGVLLDFSKIENLMLSTVRYICDNATSLEVKNNAYYVDDHKYLDKEKMLEYLNDMSRQLKNGVIEGQTYLCFDYYGKYSDIVQTYKKMLDEIYLKNYTIIGVPIEQCIDDSKSKESKNHYTIKIMIPVKIN